MKKTFAWAFCLLALGGSGYSAYHRIMALVPCARPIAYSIGPIDERFGVSRDQFAEAIHLAARAWEDVAGKTLFEEQAEGGMVVSAVYDHRQEAQDKLKELGHKADESIHSYEELKKQYDDLNLAFEMRKKEYDALKLVYDRKKAAYETALAEAEARDITADDEREINALAAEVNQAADTVNAKHAIVQKTVDQVNAVATALNRVGRETNRTIDAFNTVGGELEGEYDAGLYTRNASGEKIELFAFEDPAELKRLLTHELGHAIGLSHVTDSGSIMYYLNRATNEHLSAFDVAALKEICRL